MSPLRIADALTADAAAMLALHRTILAEGEWFVTEPDELSADVASRVQLVRDCARSDNSALLVAWRGPKLCGLVQLAGGVLRRTRHLARVEIMVDPEARGRGVGRRLMQAAVDRARARGVLRKLNLQVMAHNHVAIGLYRALGFVEEGRRVAEYRFPDGSYRDELLMALHL